MHTQMCTHTHTHTHAHTVWKGLVECVEVLAGGMEPITELHTQMSTSLTLQSVFTQTKNTATTCPTTTTTTTATTTATATIPTTTTTNTTTSVTF